MQDKRLYQFKHRLRQGLEIRNMKQVELCEKTGISKSAISQYLAGRTEAKSDRLYLIARALDVNEAWLMGYNVPMGRIDSEAAEDFEEWRKDFNKKNFPDTKSEPYYTDPETAQIAQEIFEHKELRALFSAARTATPEDLKITHDMLLALKRKERGGDD